MANQVEIRIQVDDGGSSTATASRFDSALASMTEQQKVSTAEMIKNTHELGIQTQIETELMKAKYLDMFEKVRTSGLLTASELQAVNAKMAGIKLADNMNELNAAMKLTISTTEKLAITELTAAESAAVLRLSLEKLMTTQFGVNDATARIERQMIAGTVKMGVMAVSVGEVIQAYKDANLVSEDMRKSSDELHTSFIALREEMGIALAPAFEQLNIGASHALDGFTQFVAGWEATGTRLAQFSLRIGVVLQNPFGKVSDYKEKFAEIDKIAGEELDRIYATYEDKGKKLQTALDKKKGGGAGGGTVDHTQEQEGVRIQSEILAINKEYDAAITATMSKEEQQAAQREAINQRLLLIYDKETAALMTKNLMVAQAQKQQEQYSIAFYNNALKEYAVTKNIGDAMVAATKSAVAEKLKAIGQEEAILAGKELWDGFGALAKYDLPSAGNHFIAAAGHAANAALAGVAATAVSGGGGGASAGGGASSVAQGGINSAATVEQTKNTTIYLPNDDFVSKKFVLNLANEINKAVANGEHVYLAPSEAPIYG